MRTVCTAGGGAITGAFADDDHATAIIAGSIVQVPAAGAPLSVGVIGTGAMGLGVVTSLVRAGIPAHARDIRAEAQQRAGAAGALTYASAYTLAAAADVVVILVVDADEVETALFSGAGAFAAMNQRSIVILSSTLPPAYVAALAPRLAARGVALLDAPVSGGPARAAAGTMTAMVAGDDRTYAACAEVFAAIAGTTIRVGTVPGDAAKFKILNNMLAAVNLAAGAQALALGVKAGLDPQLVLEVVNASSGASWIVADRMPRALASDYAPRAAAKILAKDAGLALDFARSHAMPAEFIASAHAAFTRAVAAGYGEVDDAVLFRLFMAEAYGESAAPE